jgi:hypothetical protein
MKTDDLIEQLSADVRPVRPLAAPALRALVWLACAVPPVLIVVAVHGVEKSPAMVLGNGRAVVEALAMIATAVTAAIAAFSSEVPGTNRHWLWLPLLPLAVWVASVGESCLADYQSVGVAALAIGSDPCLVPTIFAGIVPAAVMFAMIRRGAPLAPVTTLALGGLAVAALVNFGMMLFHVGDVSLTVLFWHGGAIAAVAAVAGLSGPRMLRWR